MGGLNKKDRRYVSDIVENEGFDYAFRHYSNFEKIKDKKFHELREKYINAGNELEEYCDLDFEEELDED